MSRLIVDLQGADDQARAVARQLLPDYGLDAFEPLAGLINHENPTVAKAACTVLFDIANESSQPGREAQRAEATRLAMRLLDAAQPAATKRMGLRLLVLCAPDGADLEPVTALLRDPELREPTRTALQRMATREAKAALAAASAEALAANDVAFGCALITSLGELQDASYVDLLAGYAGHADPAVRAHVAHALSWTGDPRFVPVLIGIWRTATPETSFETADAVLRLADSIMAAGGNWDLAMALYRTVLRESPDKRLKAAAMMGLGVHGDETAAAEIAAAAASDAELRGALITAFEVMRGANAIKAMKAAYATLPEEARPGLAAMFGRRGDAAFVDLLAEAAQSASAPLRSAGVRALAASNNETVVRVLVASVQNAQIEPELREAARAGLVRFARTASGPGAGAASLALYGVAANDDERRAALDSLARNPVPEALDVVTAAVENEPLRPNAVTALVAVAEKLVQAGDTARAMAAYQIASRYSGDAVDPGRISSEMSRLGAGNAAQMLGFVTKWRLMGPFDWAQDADYDVAFVGEPEIDLATKYEAGGVTLGWEPYETAAPSGIVDLYTHFNKREHCFAYAYAEINIKEAAECEVRLGVDDGEKLWVNGEQVLDVNRDRPLKVDEDRVRVKLNPGVNTILGRFSQVAGGWAFCVRLVKPDGAVLAFDQGAY
ncbi:MAG TPA: HEAT repeat domain-containing protein [Candidatus Bathyarchaeia archaeon]|nr:HEAT repeat domain-containing protein [Candidatus Bathyarchaeia archaeon]